MKLFIVTCLKELQKDVTKIFKDADIHAFSMAEVIGFRNNQPVNMMESWFAGGDEKADSVMLFSFTAAENAARGLDLVKEYNKKSETDFPVRAIIVPVEDTSF